jgi:hypothetical protein
MYQQMHHSDKLVAHFTFPTYFNVCTSSSVLLTHYCAGDKIEKNEMGGACSTYGGGKRRVQGFVGETYGKETTGETQP